MDTKQTQAWLVVVSGFPVVAAVCRVGAGAAAGADIFIATHFPACGAAGPGQQQARAPALLLLQCNVITAPAHTLPGH